MKPGVVISSVLVGLALLVGAGSAATATASSSPPNVVGMHLPEAESTLRAAGWIPRPFNTDTLFGIVIKRHYTICKEWPPVGRKVKILAQKYGC